MVMETRLGPNFDEVVGGVEEVKVGRIEFFTTVTFFVHGEHTSKKIDT
jgi:hypothetical protein